MTKPEPGTAKPALFTSDFSVNEFMLVKEAGFYPRGLVFGSSIFHVGIQTRRWGSNVELDKLTQAMYSARELAMARMEEEAELLGADGVVGVRLDIKYYDWGKTFRRVHRHRNHGLGKNRRELAPGGAEALYRDLNGQDFWTLLPAPVMPL